MQRTGGHRSSHWLIRTQLKLTHSHPAHQSSASLAWSLGDHCGGRRFWKSGEQAPEEEAGRASSQGYLVGTRA